MPRKHKKANKQLLFIKSKKNQQQISFFLDTFMKKQKKIIKFFFSDALKAIKNEHLNKRLFFRSCKYMFAYVHKNYCAFCLLVCFFSAFCAFFLYVGFLCKKMKSPNYLIYITTLRPANLLKKRLWHRCFPVSFVKFLRTPFLTEHI